MSIFEINCITWAGEEVSLRQYAGKVLLIVNTASQCGFTPQYAGLESLYREKNDQGLVVLGFPCNQFGHQEPGTAEQIASFCRENYSVSFPLFEKVDVNGEQAHPLFKFLKNEVPGLLGTQAIKWNFTKFLVDRTGKVYKRYAPTTKPEDLSSDIDSLLTQNTGHSEIAPAAGTVLKAAAFAAEKHKNQRRKNADASPYINHPIALADLLANVGGVCDVNVLCAALLHDTIEDTQTTAEELTQEFGEKIAGIVLEVTDDKTLAKPQRKQLQIDHAPHCSYEAKLVKLADKICNLKDVLSSPPASWTLERKKLYFDWAWQVVAGLRGCNSELERVFDSVHARYPDLV